MWSVATTATALEARDVETPVAVAQTVRVWPSLGTVVGRYLHRAFMCAHTGIPGNAHPAEFIGNARDRCLAVMLQTPGPRTPPGDRLSHLDHLRVPTCDAGGDASVTPS